jgi:tetratricopeptide (TPR) repeat protein
LSPRSVCCELESLDKDDVPEPGLKYRAFLSYSHADSGMAKRVHRHLEGFHIDKELVGRVTPLGAIPETLRPIFRDRNDFDAGASLGTQTASTLDESAALVLLASPHSARSLYVNEEVRLFKARHPERPLIPLIIDGAPDGGDSECFPPALRFALAPDGAITDVRADVLAADCREKGDGFELAVAKVVARLIGLSPDDVYRRAERERRRANRLRGLVAAAIIAVLIAAGGFYWQSHQQKLTLDEITALVDKYSIVSPAQAADPGTRRSLTEAITAIAEGATTDPRYAQALALLKAGKPNEAEPLLKAVADDKAARADKNATEAAAAYRNLASIAAVSEPGRARGYYAQAAKLDPSDIDGMFQNGWYQQNAGQLEAAQAAYTSVVALAKPVTSANANWIVWALLGTGDIQAQRGSLPAALVSYRDAQNLAEQLVKSDPGYGGWQRDLSILYSKAGDVQVTQGDLSAALTSFQTGLTISEGLAKSDPGNTDRQRDVSVFQSKVGDTQVAQGDLSAALNSFEATRTIAERLARSDSGNAELQRDLSLAYDRVGNVQLSQGNQLAGLNSLQASLAIAERLAKSDPGNAGWQRDLAVSHNKIGYVQVAQGDLPAALGSFQAGFAITERLAQSDPGNAVWQRNLSVSYINLGDMKVAQGDLPAALSSFRTAFAIRERLARSDPGNADWQRDLAVSYNKIGNVQVAQGDLPAALNSFRTAFTVAERLAKSDPGNASWQRGLALSYNKIGEVQVAQGNLPAAFGSFQAELAIVERLARSDPRNADWQDDLAVSYSELASIFLQSRQVTQAVNAFGAARAVIARLVAQHPDVPRWQQKLARLDQEIAQLKH